MLKLTLITPEQYKTQRWKNGLGETREIACDDVKGGNTPYRWRVSVADLSPKNDFSLFPGYERWIVFLGEVPVRVSHEELKRERVVPPYEPYRFSGDMTTAAISPGTTRDFNVMALKKEARATVYAISCAPGEQVQFPINGHEHFLYMAKGKLEIEDRNSKKTLTLEADQTCRFTKSDNKEYLAIRGSGLDKKSIALWTTIHLL